jgi:uncharacterized metal-binding protein YceD (DUF177 family)
VTEESPRAEYSVEVDLGALPPGGKLFKLAAAKGDCARIAKRLGVISVKMCEGEIQLKAGKTTINVAGTVRAALIRECVASLEEMDEAISESFEIEFMRDESSLDPDEKIEEWERPEIHEGDMFDVGELLVQQVSLAMDPFPRKEGAKSLADEYGMEAGSSPFAVLQQNLEKDEQNH